MSFQREAVDYFFDITMRVDIKLILNLLFAAAATVVQLCFITVFRKRWSGLYIVLKWLLVRDQQTTNKHATTNNYNNNNHNNHDHNNKQRTTTNNN
jgi:hypothetical protein